MNPKWLPYGQGCRFARSHCIKQSDNGWGACIQCGRLDKHPDRELIISDLCLLVGTAFLTRGDNDGN